MAIHFPWIKSEDAVEHVISTVRCRQTALRSCFRIDAHRREWRQISNLHFKSSSGILIYCNFFIRILFEMKNKKAYFIVYVNADL